MKVRIRIGILTLVLALLLPMAAPALAAEGETVTVLTQEGPVWIGMGGYEEHYPILYSTDQGQSWQSAKGELPSGDVEVCWTGRDYFMYEIFFSSAYTSSDGITWARLDRQWVADGWPYGGDNGLATKEFELLWTGSEYMMRQSLLDDPRTSTHQTYGNSPRNWMVTFLDEDYRIIGAKAFDAPVSAIRYADGTYYATVNEVEQSFTRSDWDPGQEGGVYYSGTAWTRQYGSATLEEPMRVTGYIIREQPGNNSPFGLAASTDGRSWIPLETQYTPDIMRLAGTGGGAVVYYCPYTGELWYYDYAKGLFGAEPSQGWKEIDLGYDFGRGVGTAWCVFTFRWTGTGYLMRQSVTGRGMMGVNADDYSPWNNCAIFLDETFHYTGHYDFGAPVLDVACVDGVYYAQVQSGEEDQDAAVIYTSTDGAAWTVSEETELPAAAPLQGRNARALLEGDVSDGELTYRLADGKLLASKDGVYFHPLLQTQAVDMALYPGEGGTLVELTAEDLSVTYAAVDWEEAEQAWTERYPAPIWYATLDGTYLSSNDVPFYVVNERIMVPLRLLAETLGFTVTWDPETNTALCVREDTSLTVYLGTSRMELNGETIEMDAPVEVRYERTCVPIRYIAQAFGLTVDWDQDSQTALLTTAPGGEDQAPAEPAVYRGQFGGQDYQIRAGIQSADPEGGADFYEEQLSTDGGQTWTTILTLNANRVEETGPTVQVTGGAVIRYNTQGGALSYCDGTGWVAAELGFDPGQGLERPVVTDGICRTGSGYLLSQRAVDYGTDGDTESPRNSVVTLLDEAFRPVGEYDLGSPVSQVACVDGVCYARAGDGIWRSEDGLSWTLSGLEQMPSLPA